MSFLTPVFLALSALAIPIILLYMLRLRRREVMVSSTMLWQKLLRDREANAPWQKLRRNLLLFLQLLILAALVLALARPYLPIPSIINGSVVVLLDASASMQATDVEPSRFEAAKEETRRFIGDLGGGSQMTIIQAGLTPTVLNPATNDKAALRQAVESAQPENGAADWAAALALAAGAVQGSDNGRILLISDGGLPDDLPPLPVEATYIPVGGSGENLALTALATRATEQGIQLFASVSNEGEMDQDALLSLTLDDVLYDSRRISVPAGSTASATWELPEGTAVIQAQLSEQADDNLALDDTAWAVHEGGVSNRVLLVTDGNLFLEQAYSVLPGIEAFKAPPDTDLIYNEDGTPAFDLYVFDSVPLPDPPPDADMLIINPPLSAAGSEAALLTVTGTFSDTVAVRLADSPLLQFVDWRNVNIREAKNVVAPWAETLVEGEGGPLLLAGERNGRRLVILPFSLNDSDLPLQIAFPILMANITDWLNPGRVFDTSTGLQPGDPVTIVPGASSTAVLITKPDGATWTADVSAEPIFFTETGQLGLYQVTLRDDNGDRPAGSFAVNLFNPAESRIAPQESVQVGQASVDTAVEENIGQRELWPWLAAAALLILLAEWWVHFRGVRRPNLKLFERLNGSKRSAN
ncbi:MAG: VWA domain-containing protein [Chloroflexi bacterium]|nr:VWA domain-containing protein [Chloroflexota bacterium]